MRLETFIRPLPYLALIRKTFLISIACTLSIIISHNMINFYDPNLGEFIKIFMISIGSIIYFSTYFLFTKALKVNKLELNLF